MGELGARVVLATAGSDEGEVCELSPKVRRRSCAKPLR
jgi:hypothetical protein